MDIVNNIMMVQVLQCRHVSLWLVIFPNVDHMFCPQDYIARFGHGSAKLARQAQSKEKVLAKMVASGLTEKVVTDKVSI